MRVEYADCSTSLVLHMLFMSLVILRVFGLRVLIQQADSTDRNEVMLWQGRVKRVEWGRW